MWTIGLLKQIDEAYQTTLRPDGCFEIPMELARSIVPTMLQHLRSDSLDHLLQLNGCHSSEELLAKIGLEQDDLP